MKGFIEVLEIQQVTRWDETDMEVTEYVKTETLISISDIARVMVSGSLVLKTPFRNGDHHCNVSESYEEIKIKIKEAQ